MLLFVLPIIRCDIHSLLVNKAVVNIFSRGPSRMDIVVSFSRKRKNFGKHCYFSDKPAEIIADIQPDHAILEEYPSFDSSPILSFYLAPLRHLSIICFFC